MATGINTGGRQAGTPNVLTKELRLILKGILNKELRNIPGLLEKLEPKDRLEIVVKLMQYVMPKIETVSMSAHEPFDADWSSGNSSSNRSRLVVVSEKSQ